MPEIKEYLPSKYEPLLSDANWAKLVKSKRNLHRALSVPHPSDIEDFLISKTGNLIIESGYIEHCKSAIHALYRFRHLSSLEYKSHIRELSMQSALMVSELRAIGRQKRIITQDMQEVLLRNDDINAAYMNAIIGKAAIAPGKELNRKYMSKQLRKLADDFYDGKRVAALETQGYCHALGWTMYDEVTATHLVPEGLDANAIARLFGTTNVNIDEPRNTLLLHKNVGKALNTGFIVIVPDSAPGKEVKWKLIVTDTDFLDETVSPGVTWNALHGRELKFLNDNRPAKRYLYFRFMITYLMIKRHGQLNWIREVEAVRHPWSIPGEYLDRSMLSSLARNVSGSILPKRFYYGMAFEASFRLLPPWGETYEDLEICLADSILMTPDYRDPETVYCGSDNGIDGHDDRDGDTGSDKDSDESFTLIS
ncbi:hypothetical protein TRV_02127 [Trichophyton verrucosum HKI 0517]|uniref:HNH nuclease domain-containing protein n=1 Tax=Trichophyton verrucosum (strain HKI 0517) TaxID=663202 RepID=D4D4W0_TRIVH|nr:uncharacterized protein TRV_02127 [Trichophyton verrucosum HKI 0517]EFE43122.1 hypothetical protein TRV_02127 [Trichophyton verrucosum HKI 0517]